MRAILVLVVIGGVVGARGARLVNLDKEEDGLGRLAEASGACDAAQPAFIKQWCEKKPLQSPRFTRKVALPVTAHGDTLLELAQGRCQL